MKWIPLTEKLCRALHRRKVRSMGWHPYFAWAPVTIEADPKNELTIRHKVWLEFVDRKCHDQHWYNYRPWFRFVILAPLIFLWPRIKWDFRPYTGDRAPIQ